STLYVGHDLAAAGATDTMLDTGVTISFRARLSVNETYPTPDGVAIRSGGKGMFSIFQAKDHGTVDPVTGDLLTGADVRGERIGFGLVVPGAGTSSQQGDYYNTKGIAPQNQKPGLIMNRHVSTFPSRNIDTDDNKPEDTDDTLNVLEMPLESLTAWHEFWITIVEDHSQNSTHRVDVYVDGSLTPNTFWVTAARGPGLEYPNFDYTPHDIWRNHIEMGSCRTSSSGAFDVDFFSFRMGAVAPVPEPATIGLLALGGLALLRRRRATTRPTA
ncbi:MAG: PEP-CTERM sorting domain-containing protein, partial [Phycisphaerae bacterium]